ncbi:hypothetical protein GCM10022419_074100 [Nonomuraea rosea]|uniref:Aminoglycoside phosphotransferase domain-containing protein n=1 Tax=Nonomuraea rosea TaxID=638574 RepID=A0ABP6YG63_9ACTN
MTSGHAVRVAVSLAQEHGITVREPVVLNDSFNLRIHLRPAPIVARVPTVTALGRERPEQALLRELQVVSFLYGLGAPVVPPSALLPPGPHVRDGVAVSFHAYAEHDPAYAVTPDAAGKVLAELHAGLREFPGELRYLGPVLDEPVRLLELLDGEVEPDALAGCETRTRSWSRGSAGLPRAGRRPSMGTRIRAICSPPPPGCCGTTSRSA